MGPGYEPETPSVRCFATAYIPQPRCVGLPAAAPTGILNAAQPACKNMPSIPDGEDCIADCLPGYEPDVPLLRSVGSMLVPPNFNCLPAPCQMHSVKFAPKVACK